MQVKEPVFCSQFFLQRTGNDSRSVSCDGRCRINTHVRVHLQSGVFTVSCVPPDCGLM